MSFEIIATSRFKRDIKKLLKKYASLKKEFGELLDCLEENPQLGTHLGNDCYKLHLKARANQVVLELSLIS